MITTTKKTEKENLSDDELFELHLKWKEDLQKLSTEELFENKQLKKEILFAKTKIN